MLYIEWLMGLGIKPFPLAPRTRVRRGRVVEIPEKWRGRTVHPETIRKRPSKHIHKLRKVVKHYGSRVGYAKRAEADWVREEIAEGVADAVEMGRGG